MTGSRQIPVAEGLFTWPADEPRLIAARCAGCGLIGFPAGRPASGAAGPRSPRRCSRTGAPLGVEQVAAHRLLQIDVPPVAEQFDHPVGMQRHRQQDLDRVNLDAARRQLGGRGEGASGRPVRLALRTAFVARIDERDDLDVRVVNVGANVQVVDPAETDERGPHRPVIGYEGHSDDSLGDSIECDSRPPWVHICPLGAYGTGRPILHAR